MSIFTLLLFISVIILAYFAISEYTRPGYISEGFSGISSMPYWANFVSPRSDIGPGQEDEKFIRDPRYFNGYVDVSRLGVEYDFCRVLAAKETPDDKFLACALAGTEGLRSTLFRTSSVTNGLKLSYDDYMRDIDGDGRADYCRILQQSDSSWQTTCLKATDTGFDPTESVDPDPPSEVLTLLEFYQGCVTWLRFMGNMSDSVNNVKVFSIKMGIDETPRRGVSQGLSFNGDNQFIRVSDASDLSLGAKVPLRSVRAVMAWVKFDAFTNNAKIFDFGNGKGRDNFFLGILGKGDPDLESGAGLRDDAATATVPKEPSGAQPVDEMSPERLMLTTSANVDEWKCDGFEAMPRKLPGSFPGSDANKKPSKKATLIYEVWDKQQRKMRMKVNNIVPLGKWVHICVTALNSDAFRPSIGIYVNGKIVLERPGGFLPSTGNMTNCYIGKSNWANSVSKYEDRDELFKGRIFDFRMYKTFLSDVVIQDSVKWGKDILGVQKRFRDDS